MNDSEIRSAVDSVREEVVATRRRLHQNPELGFEELATAELIANRCSELGYAVRTGVGKTGVVADLDSGRPGPTLMLRADMDALPIAERHDFAFASHNGAMHACGHDGHVAMQLGVAGLLAANRQWNGKLRLCFQPAEEVAGGAEPMIKDGVLDGVDRVFGIHLFAPIPSGTVGVKTGAVFGSADAFTITVRGKGGHGGMPHLSVDPIATAAQIIDGLQTIVSRETSPFSPAVVTVGKITGGSAFNIIAEEVTLVGTVRAFSGDERDRILNRVETIAATTAAAHNATTTFEVAYSTPPVVSDEQSAEIIRAAAREAVGEDHLLDPQPVTVGDDVALFLNEVPGCYFLVGAGYHDRANAPHHHPEFDIDEACLPVGVETMTRAALAVLR